MLKGKNILIVFGGALAAFGCLMPWFWVKTLPGSTTISSIPDIGLLTGWQGLTVFSIALAAAGLQWVYRKLSWLVALYLGALALILMSSNLFAFGPAYFTCAFGYYMSMAGLALTVFGGYWDYRKATKDSAK